MFFAAANLVTQTVEPCAPWDFKPTENITEAIRKDKSGDGARHQFTHNPNTRHCFYSVFEGVNPNQRISQENPPHAAMGIAVDYDHESSDERIRLAVSEAKIKPAYTEKSLGRKPRLIFTFPFKLYMNEADFTNYFYTRVIDWLSLESLLPGLDRPALTTPSRLLCNGCDWTNTGHGPIPAEQLQAFYVKCAREFNFQSKSTTAVPLEKVEKALREKFPNFDWPGDFSLNSQGPSFWIPGSTSPMSAIVKADGMFSFAAHSGDKPFHTWADILGPDFISGYSNDAITKATLDIWWDGFSFWRKKSGDWTSMKKDELVLHLHKNCGIPKTVPKGKTDLMDEALNHIYSFNDVKGAGPHVFKPPGLITYQGRRQLNTYLNNVIKPAAGTAKWGPHGEFPFISALIEALLPDPIARARLMAWFKYYYESGLNQTPRPGQMITGAGEVNTGKTLLSRKVIGAAVGGYVDASEFLIRGSTFNMGLFSRPHWVVDDDTVADSAAAQSLVQAIFKKYVANHDFLANEKFIKSGMISWMGRIFLTTNLDYISARIIGTLENGSMDKISLYRFSKPSWRYPSRDETERLIELELPFFLRWIVDHVPPDFVEKDSRYGYKPHHDSTMLENAHLSSRVAPFKELLIDALIFWFGEHKDAKEWRGTQTQLHRLIVACPQSEHIMRSIKMNEVIRYLEGIHRDQCIPCRVEPGAFKLRYWIFDRFQLINPAPEPPTGDANHFSK